MTQELEDAYNEWLLKFGFKWVKGYVASRQLEWETLRVLFSKHLHYRNDNAFEEPYFQLKQPHEILDTETGM